MCQLGAVLGFDGAYEPRHDIVEDADLLLGVARSAVDEEIGEAREHLDPARVGARGERGLDLVDEGESSQHARAPPS